MCLGQGAAWRGSGLRAPRVVVPGSQTLGLRQGCPELTPSSPAPWAPHPRAPQAQPCPPLPVWSSRRALPARLLSPSDLSLDSSDLVMLKSLLAGLSLPGRDGGADRVLDEEGEGEWGWTSAGKGGVGLPWVALGCRWPQLCDAHAAPGGAVARMTSSTCPLGPARSSLPLPGCIRVPAPIPRPPLPRRQPGACSSVSGEWWVREQAEDQGPL